METVWGSEVCGVMLLTEAGNCLMLWYVFSSTVLVWRQRYFKTSKTECCNTTKGKGENIICDWVNWHFPHTVFHTFLHTVSKYRKGNQIWSSTDELLYCTGLVLSLTLQAKTQRSRQEVQWVRVVFCSVCCFISYPHFRWELGEIMWESPGKTFDSVQGLQCVFLMTVLKQDLWTEELSWGTPSLYN